MNISKITLLISSKSVKNVQASISVYIHKFQIYKDKLPTEEHPIAESRKDRNFGPERRWREKHKVTETDTEKNGHGREKIPVEIYFT